MQVILTFKIINQRQTKNVILKIKNRSL